MRLPFQKVETIGNHFVLVKADQVCGLGLEDLARALCAARYGIGADGLLVLGKDDQGLSLRMFNPDGSEDFCGNGLRCAVWAAHQQGWVEGATLIRHLGRTVQASVSQDGEATVVLPPADFAPASVPVLSGQEFVDRELHGLIGTAVSTGSAHFVVMAPELPGDALFFGTSPLIEHDPVFPERVSVIYTKTLAPGRLQLRIWERGAGETLGCGTGSAAAAVVYARKTGHQGTILVSNPGGDLAVELADWRGPATTASRPREVFAGDVVFGGQHAQQPRR